MVPIGPLGLSLPRAIETGDAQTAVTFPSGVIAIRPGQVSVQVTISPLDPAGGPAAPAGLRFDGNAYRVQAYYAPSGDEVRLAGPITVVIRYPLHATLVLRSAGAGWEVLPATRYPGTMQILANSDRLGVFVPATTAGRAIPAWMPYLVAAAGLAAAFAGFLLLRRRGRRLPDS